MLRTGSIACFGCGTERGLRCVIAGTQRSMLAPVRVISHATWAGTRMRLLTLTVFTTLSGESVGRAPGRWSTRARSRCCTSTARRSGTTLPRTPTSRSPPRAATRSTTPHLRGRLQRPTGERVSAASPRPQPPEGLVRRLVGDDEHRLTGGARCVSHQMPWRARTGIT